MADQRSAFRFRLPWLPPQPPPPQPQPPRPAVAPRPVTPSSIPPRGTPVRIPTNPSLPPQTPLETQIPSRTPIQAPPQTQEINVPTQITTPPPPPQSGETQTPSAPPTQIAETNAIAQPPITDISTPPQSVESQNTIQPPEISSADPTPVIPLEEAPPQAPLPPKVTSESQPLSPSRSQATTQSQVPSQPSSPSRAAAQTRVRSQPSSPSRTPAQPRVPSQPSSPSRIAAPPGGVTSQPSSPSRPAAQPRGVTSQPSSPSRGATTQSQTSPKPLTSTRAVLSPSRAVPPPRAITPPSTPASQSPSTPETTSQPQSESLLTSGSIYVSSSSPPGQQHKPLSETITESTSPNQPKPNQERLQHSYTSHKNSPSSSDKDKDQENKSRKVELKAHNGLNDSMNQTFRQPPDESNPSKWSDQTDKRGKSSVESQAKHFSEDLKPEETKEVKEVLKEINDKTYEHEDHNVVVSDIQAKDQTHETHIGGKKVNLISTSNEKETKNTSQGRNKTMVGTDPHPHPHPHHPHPKQATSTTTHIPRHKEIRDDISKLVHKMGTEDPKNSTTDKPVSVITLAGENRGATMQLGFESSKQREAIHIRRGYKLKPDENVGTTTNEEGSLKDKSKDTNGIEDQAREAYVNSNIQGINNSIMFESSISERNPGVHIIHSQFPKEATRKQDFHEKQNGKSHMVHAQKLNHHPMVRRRCLRGLFMESSDSDSDDTSKPRRHGCRVESGNKSEDNKNDVL